MIFNSLTYILFLFLFCIVYWRLSVSLKLWLIVIASLTFYGFWRIEFVSLLIFSTTLDYFVARSMAKATASSRKLLLLLSLSCNLGLLLFFKYLYFLHENITFGMNFFGINIPPLNLEVILPLGISFYTFQTISYTVDVYRGHIKAEKNFVAFACYVMFFPQLIAGPILRAHEILPQLKNNKSFLESDFAVGIRRILYGLFLKVVIADNIAPLVDEGFLVPSEFLGAFDVWTLAFLFGFQIYFDFSAYSHIAIGTAKLLGINFPENFNFPYIAKNPRDFWKRWHISLSSWIRDYLYLPLIGAKVISRSEGGLGDAVGVAKQKSNNGSLFLTWGIMGLWHGASWTFLIWGIYHATIIYLYRLLRKTFLARAFSKFAILITMPLMMIGWIPFRASSVSQTFELWSHVFTPLKYISPLGLRENSYLVALILLLGFGTSYLFRRWLFEGEQNSMNFFSSVFNISLFTVITLLVIIFLRPVAQFIYFQF